MEFHIDANHVSLWYRSASRVIHSRIFGISNSHVIHICMLNVTVIYTLVAQKNPRT